MASNRLLTTDFNGLFLLAALVVEMLNFLVLVLLITVGIVSFTAIYFECRKQIANRQQFFERWPAISEKEFLRRCSEGVRPHIALRARRIISEQVGIPYEHVYPEQRLDELAD